MGVYECPKCELTGSHIETLEGNHFHCQQCTTTDYKSMPIKITRKEAKNDDPSEHDSCKHSEPEPASKPKRRNPSRTESTIGGQRRVGKVGGGGKRGSKTDWERYLTSRGLI